MGTLLQDMRYGLRTMAKNPVFTAIVIVTLALGIGGAATVFSWVRSVLVNPLPGIADASRVVVAETVMPDGSYHTSSYPDYRDYRDRNDVFSGLIGDELIPVNMSLREKASAIRVWGFIVTANYFDVLGVRPAIGRTFHPTATDDKSLDSDPYIVLGHGLWVSRFGSDPNVVGRTIQINGHPFTVIGVAPRGFGGAIAGIYGDFWVPMMMQPEVLPGENLEERSPTFVHIMGRLRPGASVAQAQAEMSALAHHLASEYPDTNKEVGILVSPVWRAHYGVQDSLRMVLGFLAIVAAFVLLIACVNVANMLLARATAREKEIAIRAAMGASRRRLVRQLLIESLILACAGGAGGILLALWGVNLLTLFFPPAHLPFGLALGVDRAVLGFTVILSLATGVVFGLAPAWRASRTDFNDALKESGRTSGAGAGSHLLRDVLVVSEVVLATVLLIGAGLLVRSLRNLESAGPGFNPHHVFVAAFDLRADGYTDQQAAIYYDRLRDRVRTLPGVTSVSFEQYVPLWFYGRSYTRVDVEGYTPKPNQDMGIDDNFVGPAYFHTVQIPMVAGRDFLEQDRAEAPKVVIINQTMARRFWPGQDPVGHRVRVWGEWRTVAGVAADIKYHGMNEKPEPFLYLPALQAPQTSTNLLVRTQGNPNALLGAVQAEARAIDPAVQPLESDDLENLLHGSLFANSAAASLALVLGGLGILLAAIGVYGVLSYAVSQRVREIGIRMALGAQKTDVMHLVVGHGLRLAILGAAIGVVVALAAAKLMSSLLFGVSGSDPLTFVLVVIFVAFAAALAAYVPARRAMRVDPMVALRYE
ncbi:MAG: ABC transporter permease [Candidatus Acidiferrales bacterium]